MNYSISIQDVLNVDAGRGMRAVNAAQIEQAIAEDSPIDEFIAWTSDSQLVPFIHPDEMTEKQKTRFDEMVREYKEQQIRKAQEIYGHVPDAAADALMTLLAAAEQHKSNPNPDVPEFLEMMYHILGKQNKTRRLIAFAYPTYEEKLALQLEIELDAKRVLATTEAIIIADSPILAALRLYMDGRSELFDGRSDKKVLVISPEFLNTRDVSPLCDRRSAEKAQEALEALSSFYPIIYDTRVSLLFAPDEKLPDEFSWMHAVQSESVGELSRMYWQYVEHDRFYHGDEKIPPAIRKCWMEYAAARISLFDGAFASGKDNEILVEALQRAVEKYNTLLSQWDLPWFDLDRLIDESDEAKIFAQALSAGAQVWGAMEEDEIEELFAAAEMDASREEIAELAEQIVSDSIGLSAMRDQLVRQRKEETKREEMLSMGRDALLKMFGAGN